MKKRARRLTGLEIFEVSGVTKSSGVGTKILLRKGATEEDPMDFKKFKRLAKEAKRNDPERIAKREAKAVRKVMERVDGAIAAMRAADPSLVFKSREVVIAKIANSREHGQLWAEYRAATEGVTKLGGGSLPQQTTVNTDINRVPSLAIPVTPLKPQPVTDATATTLEGLVAAHQRANPGTSTPYAWKAVMATSEGMAAYRASKDDRILGDMARIGIGPIGSARRVA